MKAPIVHCSGKEFLESLAWRSWDDRVTQDEIITFEVLTVHFERETMRIRLEEHPLLGKQVVDVDARVYLKTLE